MGLDNLLATLEKRDSVTPVTSVTLDDVTPKPAWIKACTPVTPVTPQNNVTANDATMTDGKPETLLDKRREHRGAKVRAMLEAAPGTGYAMLVEDATTDPVICTIAIRGKAAFEVEIPHRFYDGIAFLELIDRRSAESSVEPPQLCGNATERNQAQPGRRAA